MKTHTFNDSSNIIYSKSDIFQSTIDRVKSKELGCTVLIPHVCNNVNGFGAGFASAVAINYPEVKVNFHMLGNSAKLGHVQYVSVFKDTKYHHEIIFANMIAQNGIISNKNTRHLNYIALAYCLSNINAYIKKYLSDDSSKKIEIHAPKFGSGLAGGNWNFIKNMIDDALPNYTTIIYSK